MVFLLAVASLPASALFTLQRIEVEGAQGLTADEVRTASGLVTGSGSVFAVNALEVTRRLLRHPRIASAQLRPRPPHSVVIRISERVPVAAVPAARGVALVDRDGVVVEIQDARPGLLLVSERGRPLPWVAPGERVPSAAVRTALNVIALLPQALKEEVVHLQVTPTQEVFLYTVDGLEIRAGPRRGLRQRLAEAPEILRTVRAQGIDLEYIDLSLPDQAIIKPRNRGGGGSEPPKEESPQGRGNRR